MPFSDIESLAQHYTPGTGRVTVRPVGVGLVNATYRVEREGRRYSLRVAAAAAPELGLDHVWESRVLACAATAGLTPFVECCDPAAGVLLTRWVQGHSWSTLEVLGRRGIARVAQLLREIHALPVPQPARTLDAAQWIAFYERALRARARAGTTRLSGLQSARDRWLALHARLPCGGKVLCHSDLHPFNIVDTGERLVLLDWEYAHVSEPLWDLASWAANNDLDRDACRRLLEAYVGAVPAHEECSRLQLLAWGYDYVCLLWSELYTCLRPDAAGIVTARADVLAARLAVQCGSRAGQVPAQ